MNLGVWGVWDSSEGRLAGPVIGCGREGWECIGPGVWGRSEGWLDGPATDS